MARKIIYLVNPISGGKRKDSMLDQLSERTSNQGIAFEILPAQVTRNYSALIEQIRSEQISDVVVCGGDGTINAVASALRHIEVNIGIIPMGSGNGLAFTAKIPKQIDRALDIIFAGNSTWVDGLLINNHFSCMLSGIGFDARVAHEFAKEKKRGMGTYLRVSLNQFLKAVPHSFEIDWGGATIRTEAFFISIANSNQFGNHVTIAPKASIHDGLLDIVVVQKMNRFLAIFSVLQQVLGFNPVRHSHNFRKHGGTLYFQTDALNIRNLSMAPLHVDGDPRPTSLLFEVRILKHCFRLLIP